MLDKISTAVDRGRGPVRWKVGFQRTLMWKWENVVAAADLINVHRSCFGVSVAATTGWQHVLVLYRKINLPISERV